MKKYIVYIMLVMFCVVSLMGCTKGTLSGVPSVPQDDQTGEQTLPDGTSENGVPDSGNDELGFTVFPATEEEKPEEPPVETDPETEKIQKLLSEMTLEERVAQMFFASCPASGATDVLSQYALGGYILFASNFSGLTADDVRSMLDGFQEAAKIPMLIGVDEEGGTVVRVSANPSLREERFRSPRELFAEGGMELLVSDAHEKSQLLLSLGINVNLAPVCDISANEDDFMYERSFGGDAASVSDYVTQVVSVMREDGIGSVLKHFPGYGNCADTHEGIVVDHRAEEDFHVSDLLPFKEGILSGAGAVMVCHNIVEAFDDKFPASLSPAVHDLLRKTLGDDVVVMTDDLDMEGITDYTDGAAAAVQAVLAGNDMLLTSNYETNIRAILDAVEAGKVTEERINESVTRILQWKIELGLIEV